MFRKIIYSAVITSFDNDTDIYKFYIGYKIKIVVSKYVPHGKPIEEWKIIYPESMKGIIIKNSHIKINK